MDVYQASQHIRTKTKVKGGTLHEWFVGFSCPNCGANLPAMGGKPVRCRKCKRTVRLSEDRYTLAVESADNTAKTPEQLQAENAELRAKLDKITLLALPYNRSQCIDSNRLSQIRDVLRGEEVEVIQ